MPDQTEIWKAALAFHRQHGRRSLDEADKRIAELEQFGQTETCELWIEIRLAIAKLVDANQGKPN